jgi:hypothetical protein
VLFGGRIRAVQGFEDIGTGRGVLMSPASLFGSDRAGLDRGFVTFTRRWDGLVLEAESDSDFVDEVFETMHE